jgi:hypothetical protein
LFCVGSGLATGLIPRPRYLTDRLQETSELVNSEWAQGREPNPTGQKEKNFVARMYYKPSRLVGKSFLLRADIYSAGQQSLLLNNKKHNAVL